VDIPKLRDVRKILRKQEVCANDELPIGTVLIYSAYVGEDERELSRLSRLSMAYVAELCGNLRKNGVFGKQINHFSDYMESKNGGMTLALDISCGLNLLQRGSRDGEATYKMTDEGIDYVENDLLKRVAG
jgi:hypothetical protein